MRLLGGMAMACMFLSTAASDRGAAPIVILYQEGRAEYALRCPPGLCRAQSIDSVSCDEPHARTVVVAGHSAPPSYLGTSAANLARAVRCFAPEIVVLDTCFGASSPLLLALASSATAPVPLVVGATFRVQRGGLRYLPDFFSAATGAAAIEEQAAAVQTWSGIPLLRWRPHQEPIEAAQTALIALSDAERTQRSQVPWAPLISTEVSPGQRILVLASDRR